MSYRWRQWCEILPHFCHVTIAWSDPIVILNYGSLSPALLRSTRDEWVKQRSTELLIPFLETVGGRIKAICCLDVSTEGERIRSKWEVRHWNGLIWDDVGGVDEKGGWGDSRGRDDWGNEMSVPGLQESWRDRFGSALSMGSCRFLCILCVTSVSREPWHEVKLQASSTWAVSPRIPAGLEISKPFSLGELAA